MTFFLSFIFSIVFFYNYFFSFLSFSFFYFFIFFFFEFLFVRSFCLFLSLYFSVFVWHQFFLFLFFSLFFISFLLGSQKNKTPDIPIYHGRSLSQPFLFLFFLSSSFFSLFCLQSISSYVFLPFCYLLPVRFSKKQNSEYTDISWSFCVTINF